MRIEDVNLGGGLFRLDVTPTAWGENVNNVPTRVMDDIMRDVVNRKKGNERCGCVKPCACTTSRTATPTWGRTSTTCQCRPQQVPNREPDGFDAHIDKPRREMYGGWDAERGFQNDMRKYREAERAVKACTWPCREPMKGLNEFQREMAQHPRVEVRPHTCGCHKNTANRCSEREMKQVLHELVDVLLG